MVPDRLQDSVERNCQGLLKITCASRTCQRHVTLRRYTNSRMLSPIQDHEHKPCKHRQQGKRSRMLQAKIPRKHNRVLTQQWLCTVATRLLDRCHDMSCKHCGNVQGSWHILPTRGHDYINGLVFERHQTLLTWVESSSAIVLLQLSHACIGSAPPHTPSAKVSEQHITLRPALSRCFRITCRRSPKLETCLQRAR